MDYEENKLITVLTDGDICLHINQANKLIVFCSKSIHPEIAGALRQAVKNHITVKVIIDLSEETFRNGYGDFNAVKQMEKAGIELYNLRGNDLSFIITDDYGYFLFPQSRVFSISPEGPNAVLMNSVTRSRLIANFFPSLLDPCLDPKVAAIEVAGKQESQPSLFSDSTAEDTLIEALKKEELERIDEELTRIPPLHPDLRRQMSVYTAQIQFVEFSFRGSKFNRMKIPLPVDALPFQNRELMTRLETKLNLFDRIEESPAYQKLENIRFQVDALRHKHKKNLNRAGQTTLDGHSDELSAERPIGILIPLRCREHKSIIRVCDKHRFEQEISRIIDQINQIEYEIFEAIEGEIGNTVNGFAADLILYFESNPTEELFGLSGDVLEKKIYEKIDSILSKIKFPTPDQIINKIELRYHYYDLTFDDFSDERLLDELRSYGLITNDDKHNILKVTSAFAGVNHHSKSFNDLNLDDISKMDIF